MLYATDDKLYVRTGNGYYEAMISVEGGRYRVSVVGNAVRSRPCGASQVLASEIIARHHLTDGMTYPVRKITPQPQVQPPVKEVAARKR